jgi:hypothetical protein
MCAIVAILVTGAVIAAIGTIAFALVVVSIKKVDRSKRLMSEPRNHIDAATRRILGSRPSSCIRRAKES